MANERQTSWTGWALAVLLGTAVVAPQVGTEKTPPPQAAANADKGSHRPAGAAEQTLSGGLRKTTLSPLARFLDPRRVAPAYSSQEIAIRGEQGKPSWELKGQAPSSPEEMKAAWESAHRIETRPDPDGKDLLSQNPHLRLLLACLPDPEYPDLLPMHDLYLQAMKEQLHRLGWFFAGHWYPEMESPGRVPDAFRLMPRSVLFSRPMQSPRNWELGPSRDARMAPSEGNHELLLVLLVPENPTRGIDRPRLRAALQLIHLWRKADLNKDLARWQRYQSAQARATQDAGEFGRWIEKEDHPGWIPLAKKAKQLAQLPMPLSESASSQVWEKWKAELQQFPPEPNGNASRGDLPRITQASLNYVNRLWSLAAEAYSFGRQLKVLGPYYSTSASALGEELSLKAGLPLQPALVISPTSTTPGKRRGFWPVETTAVFLAPEDEQALSRGVWRDFQDGLTKRGSVWAYVKESDTAFGGVHGGWNPGTATDGSLEYKLPSHLTALRQAKGGAESDPLATLGGPLRSAMARFRPLALDWKGAGSNPELAPLDPHPAVNVDLEFQSLVRDLKSRNVKGVLISMSSLPNTLFIASQLRVHLPDLILVTTMLHGQWLHPDLTKDMEGLYIFSYHSPHPGKWRMQLTREARPTVRFAPSRIDDRSSPLAQVSTPLVQDAVWLLEHAYFQGHHWGLFEAPDGPSRDLWFLDRSGRWTLRRPLYVSQLRHGQLRPVHVDLEPLPGDAGGPVENPVRFKASGLFGHGQAIATTGSMRVDESYLLLGRFQRICLPLIALGLLLFAVRPSWKLRAGPVDPTSGSLLGMLLAFSALALCGLVSCLHACLWVLKNTGGPLPYLWLETLLLVIAVIAICGLAAGRLAGGFLSLQGAALRGWVKKFKKPILDKLASSTWVPACFFALIVLVPSLLLLDQRIKDVSLQPGKGNPAEGFASFLRVLAGLEPLTGLAYLPPLLAICAFLALAIRFEGQRIFHRQRNALLATPNAAPGAGSNAEPRQWQPVVFSLAIAAILYAPFLFQGGFRATRLLPLDSHRFVELLIGAGFIGIAAYALWQFLKAWRLWRRLKRESIAMEVAPWRGSYPEVGRQYPWRPSRSISPFANDNRSLPFKIFEENLVRDPLSVAPELPAIREGIRELADPGTGKRAEITIVGKLDQILASILQCSASLNTDAEGRLHALYTYLYFRRKLWDVKYRIYLSFAASFGLLFGGAAGLQGSQSLLLVALAGIGVQVALVFRLVLDLEGNGLFSAVAGTVPGKANWNQDTWAALIKPVGLALLALLVASFPGLGAAVAGLILR